jgi:hypothetical protein
MPAELEPIDGGARLHVVEGDDIMRVLRADRASFVLRIEIRLLKIGRRLEAFVNGKRVLDAPLAANASNLTTYLQSVGATVVIKSVESAELIEKPAPLKATRP